MFQVNKVKLFFFYTLPMLILASGHLFVEYFGPICLAIFLLSILVHYSKRLRGHDRRKYSPMRFYSEGIFILVIFCFLFYLGDIDQLVPNKKLGYYIGQALSFLVIVSFIDFSFQFARLLYEDLHKKPTLTEKIYILLSVIFFPFGLYHIKYLIEKAPNQPTNN
jgi:hypothetical protein